MLLLEGYISNFTGVRYYFLYVEFSGSYVNQFLAGQTLHFAIFFYKGGILSHLVQLASKKNGK
jgi:hypothetical protein